jgi:hypothetical protein
MDVIKKSQLEKEIEEDVVSRKSVLNLINSDWKYEGLEVLINNLPSVTPTQKKGNWINGNPICPCCGEDKFKDLDADIFADWKPNFCPNCGADMKESEENDE